MLEFPRTKENWTWGIINIPLIYGHNNKYGVNPRTIVRKVAHNARCYKTPFPVLNKKQRYLWFELDTHDRVKHQQVLAFLEAMHLAVYWHETGKGYHYITVEPLTKDDYEFRMNYLKTVFDNMTFSYSLRIVPNKWKYEDEMWYNGGIEFNGAPRQDLLLLFHIRKAINQPYVFNYGRTTPQTVMMLDNIFCISRYQFKKHLLV